MKRLNQLFFIAIILIAACSPPVVFNKPFPPNEDNLTSIPEKYHGLYMCESDSTLVVINDAVIYARQPYYFEERIADLVEFEECQYINGEIIMNETGEVVPVEDMGDGWVRGHFIEQDTLFQIGEYAIARPYDGSLLLSKSFKKGEWAVYGLTKDSRGDVIYRAINEGTDLELVDDISSLIQLEKEDVDDPPRYMVNPTLVEFDRMFRNELIYIECEKLIRVRFEELSNNFF